MVIGGGKVGLGKLKGLLEAGARIRVIDPKPLSELFRLAKKKKIDLVPRSYRAGDLSRAFAAVAATDDRQTNQAIRREAKRKKVLLNVVDKPEFCDFVFPAVVRRGDFSVSISTGGASPSLAKKVREELEGLFGPEYGLLVRLMLSLREKTSPGPARSRLFRQFVRSPVLASLKKRNWMEVDRLLRRYFGYSVRSLGMGRRL